MTDQSPKPLLSEDEFRILEAVVRTEARSMDEKSKAMVQLQAQLEARMDWSNADDRARAACLLRSLSECEESMERLRAALRAISDDALARLTSAQRARVAHLVVNEGEAVFQAIAKVTQGTSDDA